MTEPFAQPAARSGQDTAQLVVKFEGVHRFGLRAEEALERLNGPVTLPQNAQLRGLAANPIRARFLIESRLPEERRRALDESSNTEELHRWLVLDYPSPQAARAALNVIRRSPATFLQATQDRTGADFSITPTDPQYNASFVVPQSTVNGTTTQTAHGLLGLLTAWDSVRGTAYAAVLDTGIYAPVVNGTRTPHADLLANTRLHFSRNTATVPPEGGFPNSSATDIHEPGLVRPNGSGGFVTSHGHGTHVAGLLAAAANNGAGAAGGCWHCSVMVMRIISTDAGNGTNGYTCTTVTNALNEAVANGAQVVNMSFALDNACSDPTLLGVLDAAIGQAADRHVTIVAAAGNNPDATTVRYPARNANVLSLAATSGNGAWAPFSMQAGANAKLDFAAPGERMFSTFYHSATWNNGWQAHPGTACQALGAPDNAYGYCSGTSMSSPLFAGAVGVARSANPLLSHTQVRDALAIRSNRHGEPAGNVGAGVPNMTDVVGDLTRANRGTTPLFVLYSSGSTNHFYTTVPQMASAALAGTLKHGSTGTTATYASAGSEGSPVTGYSSFPGFGSAAPAAALRIFTTVTSGGVSLQPLYRMSAAGAHAYAVSDSEKTQLEGQGYVFDGIEGYLYPASGSQPSGSVRVYRKHHSAQNDYAIFPESQLSSFTSQGYTGTLNQEVIGYACPNAASMGVCGTNAQTISVILQLLLDD